MSPPYLLTLKAGAPYAAAHDSVIGIIDKDPGVMKQLQLLATLFLHRPEVLLMSLTE